MPSRIEDYAFLGDFQTAALVGRDGSVDWLCMPRFDSGACFAALLGKPEHGRWLLAPAGAAHATGRRYRDGSLILETDFATDSGQVTVIDTMPARDRHPHLIRIVEGKRGQVAMRTELVIRFDYGHIVPWVQTIDGGIHAIGGPDALRLQSPVGVQHDAGKSIHADFTVKAGQRLAFVLTHHPSHERVPPPIDAEQRLKRTERWWQDWSARCTYQGPYRDQVLRSLITLQALRFAPTGGIVAAATTSLPEQPGGVRNWDYRFCWLRDATFTLLALLKNGYEEEAHDWRRWLLRAVAGEPADTSIMYSVVGERSLTEIELDWLPGYESSKPVRIGNAASHQFQLDVYGEVLDALYQSRKAGLEEHIAPWRIEKALLDFVCQAWDRPDEGIWEPRGGRKLFTHSRVMAWVALDRGVRAVEEFGMEGPVDQWKQLRQKLHDWICERGFNRKLNAFVQVFDSDELDASLLMIPLVGFLPATDPRVVGTVEAIGKHLMRDGFVQRYDTTKSSDGLPPGEGAFLACTFWYADNLYLMGRHDEARALFERLLGLCNDLGLLSEEYDPHAGRLVGNFPQAFSHVGLVNTAVNLTPQHQERAPARQRSAHAGGKK